MVDSRPGGHGAATEGGISDSRRTQKYGSGMRQGLVTFLVGAQTSPQQAALTARVFSARVRCTVSLLETKALTRPSRCHFRTTYRWLWELRRASAVGPLEVATRPVLQTEYRSGWPWHPPERVDCSRLDQSSSVFSLRLWARPRQMSHELWYWLRLRCLFELGANAVRPTLSLGFLLSTEAYFRGERQMSSPVELGGLYSSVAVSVSEPRVAVRWGRRDVRDQSVRSGRGPGTIRTIRLSLQSERDRRRLVLTSCWAMWGLASTSDCRLVTLGFCAERKALGSSDVLGRPVASKCRMLARLFSSVLVCTR